MASQKRWQDLHSKSHLETTNPTKQYTTLTPLHYLSLPALPPPNLNPSQLTKRYMPRIRHTCSSFSSLPISHRKKRGVTALSTHWSKHLVVSRASKPNQKMEGRKKRPGEIWHQTFTSCKVKNDWIGGTRISLKHWQGYGDACPFPAKFNPLALTTRERRKREERRRNKE